MNKHIGENPIKVVIPVTNDNEFGYQDMRTLSVPEIISDIQTEDLGKEINEAYTTYKGCCFKNQSF